MEAFSKMVLLPSEISSLLDTQSLSALDKEMHDILFSTTPDDLKWKQYSQVLQRYLHHVKARDQPIELNLVHNTPPVLEEAEKQHYVANNITDDRSILNVIKSVLPKTLRHKGEQLYEILKSSQHITWQDNGEVTINGKVLSKSHIVDLVTNAVRPVVKNEPVGWEQFSSAVMQSNVPKSVLGNSVSLSWLSLVNKKEDTRPQNSRQESPVPRATPSRRKSRRTHQPYSIPGWTRYKL